MNELYNKGTNSINGLTKSNRLLKRNIHNRNHSVDISKQRSTVFIRDQIQYNYNPINNSYSKEKGRGRYRDITHFSSANIDSSMDKSNNKAKGKQHYRNKCNEFTWDNRRPQVKQSRIKQKDIYGPIPSRVSSNHILLNNQKSSHRNKRFQEEGFIDKGSQKIAKKRLNSFNFQEDIFTFTKSFNNPGLIDRNPNSILKIKPFKSYFEIQ